MSSNALDYTITINSNFDKVNASFNAFQKNIGGGIDKINKSLNSIQLSNIIQQIGNVADGINSINAPGIELSSSMADLSAITGVTGDKLKEIEGYARDSAKTFGGSAAQGVEAYKLVLSQLNPEIAKAPDALKAMGNSINTLSKTMGGDTVAATEVLTTAMNQYQVSTADPIQASKEMAVMMNVMAAAAKEGSAELPQIKAALDNSGMAAKMANVSFAETNAAIQVLDKAGKKGSEGGIALRNVLQKLGQGRFIPPEYKSQLEGLGINTTALANKNLTLADRLKILKPAMKDTALLTAWLGEGADGATKALMSQIPEMEKLTTAIQGTNTAYEQAAVIMESPAEKNKRLKASVDDFKISLFNATDGLMAYASVIGDTTRDFSNMMPLISGASKAYSFLTNATKMQALWSGIATKAQWLLNIAMDANPIGLIVIAISALILAIVIAIKHFDQWGAAMLAMMGPIGWLINGIMIIRDQWDSIVNAFQSEGILGGLKRIGIVLLDVLLKPLQQVLEMVEKVTGYKLAGGFDSKSIKAMRASFDLITPGESKAVKGISNPKIPGIEKGGTGLGSGGGLGSAGAKKSNEAIATGGSKNTVINITLGEMIGIKTGTVTASKETTDKAASEIQDSLLRVLAMASSAGS
jgi:TP901 family phage tail tape measure protein